MAHNWNLSTAGVTVPQIRDMLYQADSALQDLGWIPAQPLPPRKQWHPAVPGHDVPESAESPESPESPESTEFESPDSPDSPGSTASPPRPQAHAKERPVARGRPAPQPAPKSITRPARGQPVPEPCPPRPATPPPARGGRAQQCQAEQDARERSQAERGPAGLSLAALFQQAEQDSRQSLPSTASEAEVAARATRILIHLVPTHPGQPAASSKGWDFCG